MWEALNYSREQSSQFKKSMRFLRSYLCRNCWVFVMFVFHKNVCANSTQHYLKATTVKSESRASVDHTLRQSVNDLCWPSRYDEHVKIQFALFYQKHNLLTSAGANSWKIHATRHLHGNSFHTNLNPGNYTKTNRRKTIQRAGRMRTWVSTRWRRVEAARVGRKLRRRRRRRRDAHPSSWRRSAPHLQPPSTVSNIITK